MTEENTENATGFLWRGRQFRICDGVYKLVGDQFVACVRRVAGDEWDCWVQTATEIHPAVRSASRAAAVDAAMLQAAQHYESLAAALRVPPVVAETPAWDGLWRGLQFQQSPLGLWWTCVIGSKIWCVRRDLGMWRARCSTGERVLVEGELCQSPATALDGVAKQMLLVLDREIADARREREAIVALGIES